MTGKIPEQDLKSLEKKTPEQDLKLPKNQWYKPEITEKKHWNNI